MVTTYDPQRYEDFEECVNSLLAQSYSPIEIVLVIENKELYERAKSDFSSREITYIHSSVGGLAEARNEGAYEAEYDVLAFIDDDCVAHPTWAEEIMESYNRHNVHATAGPCLPKWPDTVDNPKRVPKEMGWLVGTTNPEFDTEGFVRNAYGCNLSIEKEYFIELQGFDESLGKDHSKNLQGEDADLCARLEEKFQTNVWFNSNAKVEHKVYHSQLKFSWLFDRAYLQGYTKAIFKKKGNELSTEQNFISYLIKDAIPKRLSVLLFEQKVSEILSLFFIFLYCFLVGAGYIRGGIRQTS